MAKKKDKKILWSVVNLSDDFIISAETRQNAREIKYKGGEDSPY